MTRTIEGLAKRRYATVGAMAVVMLLGVACTPSATGRAPSSSGANSGLAQQAAIVSRPSDEPPPSADAAVLVDAANRLSTLEFELASVQKALPDTLLAPEARAELEREAGRLRQEIDGWKARVDRAAVAEVSVGDAAVARGDFLAARRVAKTLERVAGLHASIPPFLERVAQGLPAPAGCVVVTRNPDPSVVTDARGLERMRATGLPWKIRHEKTGIVLVLCPPGEFMMGSPAAEAGRSDVEIQHRRTIRRAFYLSETEVTQEVWQKAMGANPSRFRGATNPVEMVSWDDCQRFCAAMGLRLPSEAEWEYACRAGTTGAYAGDLGSMAWCKDNSGGSTHPVAAKKANPWGFHDMHGNVWEWCEDAYGPYPSNGATEEAATIGAERVLHGGSWNSFTGSGRSSYRGRIAPHNTSNYGGGFRVAKTP
ncbi:MAG: SUMF1/EgtB/PvdO family nonheme iron enzyme [Limnohabitans sp.]|nr:SUMF1/EgtB/PvdO family nonheme iron enzyme [Limnohabitans sp.]